MLTGRFIAAFIGVSFIAVPMLAHAAIVTQTINQTLDAAALGSLDVDVDSNGTTDFTFQSAYVPDPVLTVGFDQTSVPFASNNGVVIDSQPGNGFPTASLLHAGDVIGSGSLFSAGSFDLGNLYSSDPFNGETGNFGGQRGFLGFSFDAGGQTFYGYADVAVNSLNSATPFDLTIFSVSYNNVAGQSITAVPEPHAIASMGMSICLLVFFVAKRQGWFAKRTLALCRASR